MRATLLICIAIFTVFSVGCSGWTYQGMTVDELRNLNRRHLAGAGVEVLTHAVGHMVAATALGVEVESWDGINERYGEFSPSQGRVIGAAGWGTALAVGFMFKALGCDNDFTEGYNTMALMQTMVYPALHQINPDNDDLGLISSSGGNAEAVWGIMFAGAIALNYKEAGNGILH